MNNLVEENGKEVQIHKKGKKKSITLRTIDQEKTELLTCHGHHHQMVKHSPELN